MNDPEFYKLAEEFRLMAPWKWMRETEMFVVHDAKTDEHYFAQILGSNGEHFALAIFPGVKAGFDMYRVATSEELNADPMQILEIPQIHVAFEKKSDLSPQEYEEVLQVMPSYSRKRVLPIVQKFTPGRAPWTGDDESYRLLKLVMKQALSMLPRFKGGGAQQVFDSADEGFFFCRYIEEGSDDWTEKIEQFEEPEEVRCTTFVSPQLLKKLNSVKTVDAEFIIDCSMLNFPVADDEDGIPVFPYMFLCIDPENGVILENELLEPIPDIETLFNKFPVTVIEAIIKNDQKPVEILCCSERLEDILKAPLGLAGIEVNTIERPDFIHELHDEILHSMKPGDF